MLGEAILDYQMTGRVALPQGNRDPGWAPHNNYPCAGEDKWVAIAVGNQQEWRAFCHALGDPDWTVDTMFADEYSRIRNVGQLDRHVANWTRQHTVSEVTGLLQQHGVAAMPVMNIEDQFSDPHLRHRQAFAEVEHPHVGAEWLYGMPWLLSDTPGSVRTAAPVLGQHNDYVLHHLLGVPEAHLEQLKSSQVIY